MAFPFSEMNFMWDLIRLVPDLPPLNKISAKEAKRMIAGANKVKYDNCQILSKEGEYLFITDEKKGKWYIKEEYGVMVSEEPLIVKLIYEDQNNQDNYFDGAEELYGHESYKNLNKENVCAVCKKDNELSKFYVVPHLYRLNLPHAIKAHTSHDILLMCQICYEKAAKWQDFMKQ
jgi:hypothetical protein